MKKNKKQFPQQKALQILQLSKQQAINIAGGLKTKFNENGTPVAHFGAGG